MWEDTEKETASQILAQLRWCQCLSEGLGSCRNWRWSSTPCVMDTRDSELHHPAQARLGATYLSPFSVVGSQRSWRWLLAPHSHPAISPGWASVMLVPAREGLWQACDQVGEFLGQVVLAMAHGTTHMGHGCTLGHFSTPWMLWLAPPHFALDQCWEYLKTS